MNKCFNLCDHKFPLVRLWLGHLLSGTVGPACPGRGSAVPVACPALCPVACWSGLCESQVLSPEHRPVSVPGNDSVSAGPSTWERRLVPLSFLSFLPACPSLGCAASLGGALYYFENSFCPLLASQPAFLAVSSAEWSTVVLIKANSSPSW